MVRTWALALWGLALLMRGAGSFVYTQGPVRTLQLEDLYPTREELYPDRYTVRWISPREYTHMERGVGIVKYDAGRGTRTVLVQESDVAKYNIHNSGEFSKDRKYMLLTSQAKKVFRYSNVAEFYVYELETKQISRIGASPLQVVLWGGGRALAYVEGNDVFYIPDVTSPGHVVRVTSGGVPGQRAHGVTDWIYEEEVFNSQEAMWFSPRGDFLAVATFDDTDVESISYPHYGDPLNASYQYPQIVHFKYPKAGQNNPKVELRVYKTSNVSSDPWTISPPVEIVGEEYILGKVQWASANQVAVLWLNRRQNVSALQLCDQRTEKCDIVKVHEEPSGWIDIRHCYYDKSATKMVTIEPTTFKDMRYFHAVKVDFKNFTTEDMSPLEGTVLDVVACDHERDIVYFLLSPSQTPWQRQLWASGGEKVWCVSCTHPVCQTVSAHFAPGAAHAIVTCSGVNNPYVVFLYTAKDESFNMLLDNGRLKQLLGMYRMPLVLFNKLEVGGVAATVRLALPPFMQPGARYPMIVRVYAGPGTSKVNENFELEYSTYLTSNRSVVVAYVDVRGSGALGADHTFAVNDALGTLEVTDTLAVISNLTSLYAFIDSARVGVWGWSYGGFTTLMMLVQDRAGVLACGAAVAPVTSWLYYDSIYTERYMSTPAANPRGYAGADVLRQAAALRGRRLLLVHGSGDDNVHYQHSALLSRQLQAMDIEFEQMSYTDESHSLLGVTRHFYHTLDRFWTQCLSLPTF